MPRAYVSINWEVEGAGALSPYLAIARPGQEVERLPLTRQDVARLLADGAYLWSVIEPRREGSMQNLHNAHQPDHIEHALEMVSPDRSAGASKGINGYSPHFIGTWGE